MTPAVILENGHILPCDLPIGSVVTTQWGLRRVVRRIVVAAPAPDDVPWGV